MATPAQAPLIPAPPPAVGRQSDGDAGRDGRGHGPRPGLGPSEEDAHERVQDAVREEDTADDLTTAAGVRAYLAETAFAGADIAPLTGGTANHVFRVRLRAPYNGQATVVFKHATAFAKNYPTLAFDLARQVYEVEAMRRVRKWVPSDSLVTVPEIFLFDEEKHVIIMEDTGANSVDLKTFMKTSKPSISTSSQIGKSVGTFLGGMHAWGRGNTELCAAVKGNEQAKRMTVWAFYERLVPTLTGEDAPPKLQDPPLEVASKDVDIVKRGAEKTARACLAVDDTFVMGDFWPGNLMVRLDAQGGLERIYVVDWELAKAGLLGVELGQFCAEIHLLRRCYPEICGETASVLLEEFFGEYKKACAPDAEVVRDTLVRLGTHMVTLGARVDWGDKAVSRAVVLEGLRFVVDGYEGAGLANSIVGPLL